MGDAIDERVFVRSRKIFRRTFSRTEVGVGAALGCGLPAEARQLAGVDFSGANRACPHGVDVVALMERAQRVLT